MCARQQMAATMGIHAKNICARADASKHRLHAVPAVLVVKDLTIESGCWLAGMHVPRMRRLASELILSSIRSHSHFFPPSKHPMRDAEPKYWY